MKIEQSIQRATSMMPFVLSILGILFVVAGFASFAIPSLDHTEGVVAMVAGILMMAAASLRSGLLDLVYEQRLTRAAIQDALSNHAASEGDSGPRRMV